MQIMPYVVVVANCCILPALCMYAGFIWGRFGLPISINRGWGKKRITGIRKRKQDFFEESSEEMEVEE